MSEQISEYEPLPNVDEDGSVIEAMPPIEAKRLSELVRHDRDDPDELLRFRFLCRGGGLLLTGPTGTGKSSLSMQLMLHWAIGWPCFGIQPARPLRSLVIQAENDEGDVAEMRDGVVAGMTASDDEIQTALDSVTVIREDARTADTFMLKVVQPAVSEHRPDLLWLDPALAYLGGEANSQRDVGRFLRNLLNPLLREFGCGGVVIHHTNKPPTGTEKPDWNGSDFAYLGSGSAEWANWPRAVMALRSIGSQDVYELRAGKRGGRLGWVDDNGEKVYQQFIAHAKEPGVICWRSADPDEIEATRKPERKPKTAEDLLRLVPATEPIEKNKLILKAQNAGFGENKARGILNALVADGTLFEWRTKRPRLPDLRSLCRTEQTEPELVLHTRET